MWIATENMIEDKEKFLPLLRNVTKTFSNVIWTCSPSTDYSKCKTFCGNDWSFVNVYQIDGIEAPCVVVFGLPARDNNITSIHSFSRLFSRARNSLVLITEEKVTK